MSNPFFKSEAQPPYASLDLDTLIQKLETLIDDLEAGQELYMMDESTLSRIEDTLVSLIIAIRQKGDMPPLLKAQCLLYQGKFLALEPMSQDSEDVLTEALALFREERDRERQAETFRQRGAMYLRRGELKKSRRDFEQARRLWQKLKHTDKAMHAVTMKARVALREGAFDVARSDLHRVAAYYEREGKVDQALSTRYELALELLARAEDPDAAEEEYRAALDVVKREGTERDLAEYYQERSFAYAGAGNYEQALSEINEALAVCREQEDRAEEARTLIIKGQTQQEMQQFEHACRTHQEALSMYQELDHPTGQGNALTELGAIAADVLGRPEEGMALLGAAHRLFEMAEVRYPNRASFTLIDIAVHVLGMEQSDIDQVVDKSYERYQSDGGQAMIREALKDMESESDA